MAVQIAQRLHPLPGSTSCAPPWRIVGLRQRFRFATAHRLRGEITPSNFRIYNEDAVGRRPRDQCDQRAGGKVRR